METQNPPQLKSCVEKLSSGKTPKITVVTATYNLIKGGREEYFKKCVESVYKQNYSNIEHLIIDGASDDGTLDLIKKVATKSTVVSEPDKGIYDAFNKGVKKAQGDYIVFLNSDDYFTDENSISCSMKYLTSSNADFSYSDCYFVDESDEIKNIFYAKMEIFFYGMPFCHQTMITKKSAIIKAGGFDTKYKIAADYNLIMNLVLNGASFVKVPQVTVNFRNCGLCCAEVTEGKKEGEQVLRKYFKDALSNVDDIEYARQNFIVPKELIKTIENSKADMILKKNIADLAKNGYNLGDFVIFEGINAYTKAFKKLRLLYIPFTVKIRQSCKKFYLFKKIKLFEIAKTDGKTLYKLLNIPVVGIKSNCNEFALYLFTVPIFKR